MLLRALALAGLAGLLVPLHAQSLPSWARPSVPEAPGPASTAMTPTLPGGGVTPNQVPIDGGLGLLALAGGAYAVRRLRGR